MSITALLTPDVDNTSLGSLCVIMRNRDNMLHSNNTGYDTSALGTHGLMEIFHQ